MNEFFRAIQSEYIWYFLIVELVVIIAMIVIMISLQRKNDRLQKRLDVFLLGKNAESLEGKIESLCIDVDFMKNTLDSNKKDIRTIYRKLEKTYQSMGLVKYDAFNQMGGQLSFCLTLLDENKNGFIINSVHSTEGCYSYTKQIKAGISDIPLGKEEEESLKIALK